MRNQIICILAVLFLNSCNDTKPVETHRKSLNNFRIKVGLKPFDKSFTVFYSNNYSEREKVYKSYGVCIKNLPNFEESKENKYVGKYIGVNKTTNELVYEADIYTSGRRFASIDETFSEKLICKYNKRGYAKKEILEDLSDFYNIKEPSAEGWEYFYIFGLTYRQANASTTDKTILDKYYLKQIKLLTKKQADSILNKWNIKK